MEELNRITVRELMNLTIKLTKENIKKFNQIALSESDTESLNKLNGQYMQKTFQHNNELTLENRELINLFNSLLSFYKKYKDQIELHSDVEEIEIDNHPKSNNELMPMFEADKVQEKNTIEIEQISEGPLDYQSKSIEKLTKLMTKYIGEEKYEECQKIKVELDARGRQKDKAPFLNKFQNLSRKLF